MSTGFKVVLMALVVLPGGGALGFLHLQNAQLRRKIMSRQPAQQQAARLREENARLKNLLENNARDAAHAAAEVQVQLAEARLEAAAREKLARTQRAETAAQVARDEATLAANRDPNTGLTRLEYFRDAGQATPTAAFQTLVWAALKGDDAALAQLSQMPAATRARADALIARLPEETRGRWTPEKLANLWLTGALTELPALQITGQSFEDAEQAVVTFRAPQLGDEKLRFKLTPSGWKAVIGTGVIGNLEKKLGVAPPAGR